LIGLLGYCDHLREQDDGKAILEPCASSAEGETLMDYAKSSSGRTVWTIDQGRLHESGQDVAFRLTAVDTQVLLDLLLRNEKEIRAAAESEQSLPVHRVCATSDRKFFSVT
jgi:hypothetical protein